MDQKYFNFPIQLINGIFINKDKNLNDILYYSIYAHCEKLKLGTDIKRFGDSASYYGIGLGNPKTAYNRGMELFNSIPERSPFTGISVSMFFDFYKNRQTHFEIACLTAFLALKSIIGAEPYCKTNNALLWARMDGESKATDELSPDVLKYCNEYQTVKIKNELCLNWGLVHYSRFTKGFYVSFKMEFAELVEMAEKIRKTSKVKEMKQRERKIINEVLNNLKSKR